MLSAIGGMDDLDPAITYALKEWLLERLGNEVKAYANRASWEDRSQVVAAAKHVSNPGIEIGMKNTVNKLDMAGKANDPQGGRQAQVRRHGSRNVRG